MTGRVWPISHLRSSRLFGTSVLIFAGLLFSSQLALAQFTQQGPKLIANDAVGQASQGYSVALSGDGNTAILAALMTASLGRRGSTPAATVSGPNKAGSWSTWALLEQPSKAHRFR